MKLRPKKITDVKAKKNGEKQKKKVLPLVSLLLRWMDNFFLRSRYLLSPYRDYLNCTK